MGVREEVRVFQITRKVTASGQVPREISNERRCIQSVSSIVREAIKKFIELNDLRRPKYNLERNQKEVQRSHEVNEYRVE
mmetsp:Transcript_21410/g.27596  ORF Transcript_21410/g.27596 Transcript_21410/m.27596 type:complete len:80 (-) Transcript_21410:41-280(-)